MRRVTDVMLIDQPNTPLAVISFRTQDYRMDYLISHN